MKGSKRSYGTPQPTRVVDKENVGYGTSYYGSTYHTKNSVTGHSGSTTTTTEVITTKDPWADFAPSRSYGAGLPSAAETLEMSRKFLELVKKDNNLNSYS